MKDVLRAFFLLFAVFAIVACGGGKTRNPAGPPAPDGFIVSGAVRTAGDAGISGVSISFSGDHLPGTTREDGTWESPQLSGDVTVTPEHPDYAFKPVSRHVTEAAADVDFRAVRLYDLEGTVVDSDGDPVPGVIIGFGSAAEPVVTATDGRWKQTDLSGSVTVTPSDPAYEFNPPAREFAADATSVDFSGQLRACNEGAADTIAAPCVMTRAKQLQLMAGTLDGHYALGGNVDAAATKDWGERLDGFEPIGTETDPFTGEFDGKGHTITGLSMTHIDREHVGLFGYADGATIVEVTLADALIDGFLHVGALIGYAKDVTVTRAHSSGTVYGEEYVGGLVGTNDGGTIEDSSTAGNVTARDDDAGGLVGANTDSGVVSRSSSSAAVRGNTEIGGLVGHNRDGAEITGSYSTGTVIGDYYVGGLAGRNSATVSASYSSAVVRADDEVGGLVGYNSGGTIEESHSTGAVYGNEETGGLVGLQSSAGVIRNSYSSATVGGGLTAGGLVGTSHGLIQESHSTGIVRGTREVGGLVGYHSDFGTIQDSYSNSSVSGGDDTGGLVGSNEGNIARSYSTGTITGEDFVGGLAGQNVGDIHDSWSSASVAGEDSVGGLIGYHRAPGELDNSYSTGPVTGTGSTGGLIGHLPAGTLVTSSYWDTQTSGLATSAGGTGKTTAQMRLQATYVGWDFASAAPVWTIAEGSGYPDLVGNRRP